MLHASKTIFTNKKKTTRRYLFRVEIHFFPFKVAAALFHRTKTISGILHWKYYSNSHSTGMCNVGYRSLYWVLLMSPVLV